MSNPFVFLESINWTKEDIIKSGDEEEKNYKPFLTNRALSYHVDSIFDANDMNMRSQLPEICQYQFYINNLPRKKRFSKWTKTTKNEEVEAVMEYFGYNRTKAEQALKILSKENIAMIYDLRNKGGVKKQNEQRTTHRGSG